MTIAALLPAHYPAVKTIYEDGLATGNASFQTSAPNWEQWDKAHLAHSRLVALDGDTVAAWAALTPVSGACAYSGVAEVSVYVATSHRGQGIGRILLETLITESEANGIWTLQASIFPENTASITLHKNAGFQHIGIRHRIGKLNDRWRDNVLLEKRSKTIAL
jgi:L-amino acid N-acyltransferase YncA